PLLNRFDCSKQVRSRPQPGDGAVGPGMWCRGGWCGPRLEKEEMKAMKPPGLRFLALGLLALASSRVLAQAPGTVSPRPETFSRGMEAPVLLNPNVQSELKLTLDQVRRINDLVGETRAKFRQILGSLQNIPDQQREQREQRLQDLTRRLNFET